MAANQHPTLPLHLKKKEEEGKEWKQPLSPDDTELMKKSALENGYADPQAYYDHLLRSSPLWCDLIRKQLSVSQCEKNASPHCDFLKKEFVGCDQTPLTEDEAVQIRLGLQAKMRNMNVKEFTEYAEKEKAKLNLK